MSRRFSRAVAWRAAVLAVLAGGSGLTAAVTQGATNQGASGAGSPAAQSGVASLVSSGPAPTSLEAQAQLAQSRLPANLQAPHPGRPEAVTHPDADHMSATKPGTATLVSSVRPAAATTYTQKGLDVASYQGNVDWSSVAANGATFAYMKATEGTYYTDSAYFAQQYNGSYNAGLVRGSYHFAIPSNSTGAAQADYFVAHGGGWSADGRTLPGTLDIEYNPYSTGGECYGLTQSQMAGWVKSFDTEYKRLTGRYPTIYTTNGWWSTCTGNPTGMGLGGLAIANYSSGPGTLPVSWSTWTIWQYADSGVFPGDQDLFNGTHQQLIDFAYGPPPAPPVLASTVPLSCGTTGDQRTPAEGSIQPGVVVVSRTASGTTYQTDTVTAAGQLLGIPTSVPSHSTPLVAVWQNSTDCSGAQTSRNAWATAPNGAVYGESNQTGPAARNFGDASNVALNKPVVGMSPTRDAGGYWLVATDGGIFSYGDARFYGSTGGIRLVQPVVGMASTGDSKGYWMVASDGGIFAFGDATFHGSLGGVHLVKPIEAMVATADGRGYWMVASDGGVFCFGDAGFHGSMGGHVLSAPVAGMVPNGSGYTLIGQDGKTYPFP